LDLEVSTEFSETKERRQATEDCLDIGSALMQLDEQSREIVVLHYFSELLHAEIATALGLSSAAVHGRLQRARRKLARKLSSVRSPS